MSAFRITGLIALVFELLLAIPVLGGTIIMGSGYSALGVALIIHIIALIFTTKSDGFKAAPIFGIITSLLAWIPFLGWAMHVITFILYIIAILKVN